MKNLILSLLAMLVLASCSAPKYSYYFDQHDYNAGRRKKAVEENQKVAATQESEMVKEIPVTFAPDEQPIVIASTEKETAVVKNRSVAPIEKKKIENISKPQRKELVKQLKTAIRQYKHDSKNLTPDDDGDGGGNQLVALLLAIFLGGLGIHRFYLGRTLSGVAQLLLLIVGTIVLPLLYVLAVWVLIDIILIAMGNLTPKSGSYSKPL